MTINAYPLAWPEGWPRTSGYSRKHGRFTSYGNRLSIVDAITRIKTELEKIGVKNTSDDMVVSTNLKLNLSGLPRGDQGEPSDPGAAVYWTQKNKPMRVMAIDSYYRVADNLAAIAATLEAMRAIDRHGGAQILDRAFTGFTALPPPKSALDILGLRPGASREEISAAHRRLTAEHHPDRGGSHARMAEINAARDELLRANA